MAKKTDNENEEKETTTKEKEYSKKQLVNSKKYASNKDLLQVLLEDNNLYTLAEVDKKIEEFKKRKV